MSGIGRPCGRYGYFSGVASPENQLVFNRALLLDIQVVTGELGAVLRIGNNTDIIIPPNFSFETHEFCDEYTNTLDLTGGVTFFFISYCQAGPMRCP